MSAPAPAARRALLRRLAVPGHGAEDVVVDEQGHGITGTEDGALLRVAPDGSVTRVGHTRGRPLGIELLDEDRLLVADAERGLLTVHRRTGAVEVLVTEVAGRPLRVCNNAAVAADGSIWFSDSSAVHPLSRWRADLLEATCTGRLLRRAPDGAVEEHLTGLDFANGVALSPDGSAVHVAESGARTVVRLWLTGPRAGTRDLFAADLPGYPDNLSTGSDGLVWVTIASPPVAALERLRAHAPAAVRRLGRRVPPALLPGPVRSVHVQAYRPDGTLVHDLRLPATDFHMVTGVREHEGRLWLSSLEEAALATVELATGRVPGAPV
ncbi:SMP-30/gluconolactonase/LRE family protein [Nocardioides aurantiacus]|uniref:Sugar lactone lactonase YvrE n=1 Tax=Nocardioides aurantiacus TaxID=86796 RepID=A0A3N2CUX5_9ACTN|nr:SMP-30/gluconolactonase/LRE family protein [Nocardioides aurantiacus]ROR91331.1 sugar lactone lactonase YvrE [Nocardioides aurantiacus]